MIVSRLTRNNNNNNSNNNGDVNNNNSNNANNSSIVPTVALGTTFISMLFFILSCALPIFTYTTSSSSGSVSFFQICSTVSGFSVCQTTSSATLGCDAAGSVLEAGMAMSILATLSASAVFLSCLVRRFCPNLYSFDSSGARVVLIVLMISAVIFGLVTGALGFAFNFAGFCGSQSYSQLLSEWQLGAVAPLAIVGAFFMLVQSCMECGSSTPQLTSNTGVAVSLFGVNLTDNTSTSLRNNSNNNNNNNSNNGWNTHTTTDRNFSVNSSPSPAMGAFMAGAPASASRSGGALAAAPPPPDDQYFQHAGYTYWRQGSSGRTFWWDQGAQQWHECQQ